MTGQATARSNRRRSARFFAGFLLVSLVAAGLLSYLASPHPDGLETVAQEGCQVSTADGVKQLEGTCIARNAVDHPFATGPLAGYKIGDDDRLTGAAGVAGVLLTLTAAGGLFWLLGRRRAGPPKA